MIGQIYPIVGGLDYLKLKSTKNFEEMSKRQLNQVGINTAAEEYAAKWPINIRKIANDIAQSRLVIGDDQKRQSKSKTPKPVGSI
ncbi:hypothetical protein G3495_06490 [Shewanella baltica]|uniref:hypothetical protein n=1 Tax=Shewanella baltica TaxID=62322 RepID=UPI00217DC24F|nr:hypothetical protein [Shewanella baltica]MCS6234787.1 hypothetical protein [Shewanella baltica]MCS6268993.1 hypothetical protein [Shewanella baltica]